MLRSLLIFSLILSASPWISAAEAPFKVLNKVTLGGTAGWDYLLADADARRLYIPHGTRIEVLDMDSLQLRGTIPNTPGVRAVALAPGLGKGFATQSRVDSVLIFDLKTLKKTGEVLAGKSPDAIVFDPVTSRVFAFNSRAASVTAIDAREGEYISTLKLPGKPEAAINTGDGRLFVNLQDKNSIARIDTRGPELGEVWPISGCVEPTSLAYDPARKRLFIGCLNKVMAVIDSTNGKFVASLPIGARVDSTMFDAGTATIFNSNGDGTLTVIRQDGPDSYRVVENFPTQNGSRTAAVDTRTHRVFLAAAEFGPTEPPAPGRPYSRTPILPNTFCIWVIGQ